MVQLNEKYGDWIFITPIIGLELTDSVKEEFVVNRVIFVSKRKLPRIRKRLGLPVSISDLTDVISEDSQSFKQTVTNFFKSAATFAVLPYKGKPKEKFKDNIRIINEELNILSLSQLGWSSRQFNKKIEIKTSDKKLFFRTIDINKNQKEFTHGLKVSNNPSPLILDREWVKFHSRFYFFDLIKVIKGKTDVSTRWRTNLHHAASIIGQSQNSSDITFCFLWNVIALEMLLTNEGEKISEALVNRCEYFLGWHKDWTEKKYAYNIKNIYSKRCNFVHNGDVKQIIIDDLLFTDNLIFNIINNIIRCRNKFTDFKDIDEYSKKFNAEKILNQKSKFRFGKFELMSKEYSEDDYNQI